MRSPMRSLMRVLALVALLGCGSSDASGPIARIHQFTGCEVPPGAVRVHENVGGDETRAVIHVKVVIPKPTLDAFVRSCGFERDALRTGYDHHPMRPAEPLVWWNPPDRQLCVGASQSEGANTREIVVVERDTDFAVYLRATDGG